MIEDRGTADAYLRHYYHIGSRNVSIAEAALLLKKVREIERIKSGKAQSPMEWFEENKVG